MVNKYAIKVLLWKYEAIGIRKEKHDVALLPDSLIQKSLQNEDIDKL